MSVYIVEAGITDELIIKTFVRLCDAEVKKEISFDAPHQEGLQNGYVYCLIDLFGESDDHINAKNYKAGRSYLHVIEQIMSEDLIMCLMGDLLSKGEVEIKDILSIDKVVKQVVREFFADHKDDMRTAIKFL